MAIALTQGHVQRAIDFYNKAGKYFVIGGTTAWDDESTPDTPTTSDYKLNGLVGFKKIDNIQLVIPSANGTITYRTQNWKIISPPFNTTTSNSVVTQGTTVVTLTSISGFTVGSKIRIANIYEATITAINNNTNQITVDTVAPSNIPIGSYVEGGALVEGAKYVYVDCYLNYDQFPLVTYRQVGLSSGVTPNSSSILLSSEYSVSGNNEYTNMGVLEILDNRAPSTRNIDTRELLSLILEF